MDRESNALECKCCRNCFAILPLFRIGTQWQDAGSNKHCETVNYANDTTYSISAKQIIDFWSGRRDSNPRRPAWEAGILPLNYSRLPYSSSTYLFSKDLGRYTASLFRLLRPSKTMGFDRKMDSKVDSKPAWEASLPAFSFTVHFTVHPTTDSPYHTRRPTRITMFFIGMAEGPL